MRNGYNHHRFQYQQNPNNSNNNIQKCTFLPMLCSRNLIKDVALPRLEEDRSAASFCNDPLSPKISCMGQVKRNNKIIGFPTTNYSTNKLAFTTKSSNNDVKYLKLKRLFSAKNVTATNNDSTSSCRRRGGGGGERTEREICINISEMDPPLPVIKRMPRGDDERKNLWKRRSTGGALKSLELQHIQIPKDQLELQTV